MKNKINTFDFSWLESSSLKIVFDALEVNGAKVLVVGGCVRNTILGLTIENDIDIATDALPYEVIELAENANLKVVRSGIMHGTVTIIVGEKEFQVTTFRSDILTDGRHSIVSFSKDINEDASRRDFTMNAIYVTRTGVLLDPIDGFSDLINRNVKFIGDPSTRIKEDYLRILRYFRFFAIYSGDKFLHDTATLSACSKAIFGLKQISSERIWSEFKKLLGASKPVLALKGMEKCGVLQELLPGANINSLSLTLDYEKFLDLDPYFLNRFISLNQLMAVGWSQKLPLLKVEKRYIVSILKTVQDRASMAVKAYKYGKKNTLTSIIISHEIEFDEMDGLWITNIEQAEKKVFPLSTGDFLKICSPSERLGQEIKRVRNAWLDSNFQLERAELLKYLKSPEED